MKLYPLILLAICMAVFVSCGKTSNSSSGGSPAPLTALSISNVSYGTDPAQKMDVYLPANRSVAATKVMVLIHGGGWTTGDKADFFSFTDSLKKRLPDYAIFNINYRLSTGAVNLFPTQENDVKAALQFIVDKSADYVIGNKFVLTGASAGAHLSMLQGFKYTLPVKPRAIVSFFGPGDLTDMYNNPAGGNTSLTLALGFVIGATPVSNPSLYINSSPVSFIGAGSPPTMLLHGDADPVVSPSQSLTIKNKLAAAGVTQQYILYPGKHHGDDWDAATYTNAFNNIQAFLAANVQ